MINEFITTSDTIIDMKASGFTLIELLVVIAIIGILASTVLASLGSARARSQVTSTISELRQVSIAAETLFIHTGLYPHKKSTVCPPQLANGNEVDLSSTTAGIVATDGSYNDWKGPYMSSVLDPWGNPYYLDEDYQCTAGVEGCNGVIFTGSNYTSAIISCGPDGLRDPSNGGACAYNADNIIRAYCQG